MAWTLFGRNWLTGIICMWSGLLVDIPNGWALCDGTNGTPDLRNKFVRGAPDGVDPGAVLGDNDHRHSVSGNTGIDSPSHVHNIIGDSGVPSANSADYASVGGALSAYSLHTHGISFVSGTPDRIHRHTFFDWSTTVNNIPVYYAIAFIIKL